MAILNNSNAISSGGYDINNSLRFRSSASAYLSRTPASATNRRTYTWSGWVKRGSLGVGGRLLSSAIGTSDATHLWFGFSSGNTLQLQTWDGNRFETTALYRDPSAWYHIVLAVDTTNATAADRQIIYVNGVRASGSSGFAAFTQNTDTAINFTQQHSIGRSNYSSGSDYFDGYMTEVNFIDGQALTPSSFGETDTTTGSWKPKAYTSTYGTNGFYLKFSDIATTSGSNAGLGKDFSGNGNYWTTNNISVTAGTTYDAMIDSPTLTSATVANYPVMNPLDNSGGTITQGNLQLATGTTQGTDSTRATIAVSSAKWYWEGTYVTFSTQANAMFGVSDATVAITSSNWIGANGWFYYAANGNKYTASSGAAYGNSFTTNDIIGVALDMDNGKIFFSKNGVWQNSGDPAAGTNAAYTTLSGKTLTASLGEANGFSQTFAFNFGQRPFSYTPPTGFVRLNTYNLPDSTIKKGNTVMDATLYTGTGASLSVTNAGAFKPDFVWIKKRNGVMSPILMDSRRGTSLYLTSDSTNADVTDATVLTSFNSNGFTLGTSVGSNGSGGTFVGWQWQAGQGSSSSNTSGSITSTVSVNATAGFSIITFNSGTAGNKTVGHGLGVKPAMFILKNRASGAGNWQVWHQSFSNQAQNYLSLNTTNAVGTDSQFWANAAPTTAVLSFESAYTFLASNNIVGYCWAEIAGYSKAFSYTGNGSADGPMVYLGFRPKFIMIKRTDSTSNWVMFDTSRSTYNLQQADLYANLSDAEATNTIIPDILSNGFKVRTSNATWNTNGGTWIGMAFAENPFKNSLAR